jgi:hypothetical protein
MKAYYERLTTQLIISSGDKWFPFYETALFTQNLSRKAYMGLIESGYYTEFWEFSDLSVDEASLIELPEGTGLLIPSLWELDTVVERRVHLDEVVKRVGHRKVESECGPYELWEDWLAEPFYESETDYIEGRPSWKKKPLPIVKLSFLAKLEEMEVMCTTTHTN